MVELIYRTAKVYDFVKIAQTHIICFPNYFISKLGENLVANYYKEFVDEDNIFVIAESEGNIIGFCMGYLTGSNARDKFIANNRSSLVKRLLLLCCKFDKLAISKCFSFIKSKFVKSKPTTSVKADGDLLSICLRPEYRGSEIAPTLVFEFEKLLKEKNAKDYVLSVYKTNVGAIRFYEKCGLAIVGENDDEYKFYKKLV